jgi:hypothetical protein
MNLCETCNMDLEQPDFQLAQMERLPPDLRMTEFRSTDPVTRGFWCKRCGREWDNQGDLMRDAT